MVVINILRLLIFLRTFSLFVCYEESKTSNKDIATNLNEFGFDMYREIRKSVDGNIIFSPFSMYTAFSMLGVGARDKTFHQLSTAFHWGNFESLLKGIRPMNEHWSERRENDSVLAIANKLWISSDMNILTSYKEELLETFLAVPEKESFSSDPEGARQNINNWVEKKTEDKIKDLFPFGSISAATKLVLANAIYFEGKWSKTFNAKDTTTRNFHLLNLKTIQVDYVTREDKYAIHTDATLGVELLTIPYAGEKFSMIFVKPVKSVLAKIESIINARVINEWSNVVSSKKPNNVRIFIPKFELEQSILGLIPMLKNMGIRDLFIPNTADLSGINGNKNLFCSTVVHKSFIKVDEEGTTAAAATGIVMEETSIRITPTFIIDRPFLFYIIDRRYNVIIFSGKVMNPNESKSLILQDNIRSVKQGSSGLPLFISFVTFLYPALAVLLLI